MKGENMMSPSHKANDSKGDTYRKNYEKIFRKPKTKERHESNPSTRKSI